MSAVLFRLCALSLQQFLLLGSQMSRLAPLGAEVSPAQCF
jgi:hypothetical protein